jgi:K+-transporting ATPase ATPase C chain
MIKTTGLELKKAVLGILFLVLLLGFIYPLIVWGIAQLVFPVKASGSLVQMENRVIGSGLIGQRFTGAGFFHPRPSAAGEGYDSLVSGGSNLGPLSKILVEQVKRRVKDYREENHLPPGVPVPVDAVTASGSGLDPHIGVENAVWQAGRIAKTRGLSKERVLALIEKCTENRQLGIFGEKKVNVLLLNLELEKIKPRTLLKKGSWTSQNFLLKYNQKFLQGSRGRFFQKKPPGRRRQ